MFHPKSQPKIPLKRDLKSNKSKKHAPLPFPRAFPSYFHLCIYARVRVPVRNIEMLADAPTDLPDFR